MRDYDLNTPDAYAGHLADVNESIQVVATEDIYNSNGMLLIKKGLDLKPDIARRVLNHKLVKPLEMQVDVEETIGAQRLYEDISRLIENFADCKTIHRALKLDNPLVLECRHYAEYGLIRQKMTVMAERLPQFYQKALFCAWFSLALAHQLKLSPLNCEASFLAGLTHDIGLLHIDPTILDKQSDYTADEWRAMQSHAVIGDMILSHVEGLPEATRRAVREHHERSDGSGYPMGLFEEQVRVEGQLVAMADMLLAIAEKRQQDSPQVLSLSDLIPVLQINSTVHTAQAYAVTINTLKLLEHAPSPSVDLALLTETVSRLLTQRRDLEMRFEQLHSLKPHLGSDRQQHHQLRSARLILQRLWITVTGSGLLSDPLARWLEHVRQEGLEIAAPELAEITLMYQELDWQLKQLARAMHLVSHDVDELPDQSRQSIRQVVDPLIPASAGAGRAMAWHSAV